MLGRLWDTTFLGELVENNDRNVIINTGGSLQFFLKITSEAPGDFPREEIKITFFVEEVERFGLVDDMSLSDGERINNARNFFRDVLFFFSVERIKRRDYYTNDYKYYYKAIVSDLIEKRESFKSEQRFIVVPIFDDKAFQDRKLFEAALQGGKSLGNNSQISAVETEDVYYNILWKDQDDSLTMYGYFEKFEYTNTGFKFLADHPIRRMEMRNEWLEKCYPYNRVLFIPLDFLEEDILPVFESEGSIIEDVDPKIQQELSPTIMPEKEPNKELEFVERFIQNTIKSQLYYDTKDMYNFHTAMKSGSLVILCGMSGTGKSKIVNEYMKALGLPKANKAIIPVRPFWQDDSDIIGYLDTLNNVYRPDDSGFINFLIQAEADSENLYIACFDEMNLARVEHYFSQFLSILETEERILKLYNEEVGNRIFNGQTYPSQIKIGKNVLFVGTVNTDESTHHFSDKVLDRANVINLKRIKFSEGRSIGKENGKEQRDSYPAQKNIKISFEDFSSFIESTNSVLSDRHISFFEELHSLLSKNGRDLGIGWRILNQVDKYTMNIPSSGHLELREAFDLQIVQRIMTKIRGSEELLVNLIGKINPSNIVEKSDLIELLDKYEDISDFSQTRVVILGKAMELRNHGYTI